jgi:hypothetical protein
LLNSGDVSKGCQENIMTGEVIQSPDTLLIIGKENIHFCESYQDPVMVEIRKHSGCFKSKKTQTGGF